MSWKENLKPCCRSLTHAPPEGCRAAAAALNPEPRMYYSQRYGEVAERFKAAVLKTAELKGSVSSNLTLSAML